MKRFKKIIILSIYNVILVFLISATIQIANPELDVLILEFSLRLLIWILPIISSILLILLIYKINEKLFGWRRISILDWFSIVILTIIIMSAALYFIFGDNVAFVNTVIAISSIIGVIVGYISFVRKDENRNEI